MTPEQRYQDLIDELTGEPGVVPPPGGSGFGRSALRCHRKIFAMLVRGRLVLKLPRAGSRSWSPPATASGSTPTRAPR
jgi:hypothetical protein